MAESGRWVCFAVLLLPLFAATLTSAQTGMPGTEIYLAELLYKDGVVEIGKPGNITRRPGYDSQPSFIADHIRIFYTSYRDGQSDIVIYDHETGRTLGFRGTQQSEYSAMLTPDGTHVTVVQVEDDSTQRLWQFPSREEVPPEVLLEDRPGVGYYAWGNDSTVVLFILGSPHELHIGNVRTGVTEHVTDDIGRSLHKISARNAVSFSQREADSTWWIKSLDLGTREIQPIVAAIDESQDYVWTPGGILLMAKGSMLYQWNPKVSAEWQQIADLSQYSITGITRLAVSEDGWYLALVAEE